MATAQGYLNCCGSRGGRRRHGVIAVCIFYLAKGLLVVCLPWWADVDAHLPDSMKIVQATSASNSYRSLVCARARVPCAPSSLLTTAPS